MKYFHSSGNATWQVGSPVAAFLPPLPPHLQFSWGELRCTSQFIQRFHVSYALPSTYRPCCCTLSYPHMRLLGGARSGAQESLAPNPVFMGQWWVPTLPPGGSIGLRSPVSGARLLSSRESTDTFLVLLCLCFLSFTNGNDKSPRLSPGLSWG